MSKYKCCLINLQYNCSVAKSRVGSLPPTASRIEAKLFSTPYRSSSDGFICCHPPTFPPPLIPLLLLPLPHISYAPFTLDFLLFSRHTVLFHCSALHTCYSLCLQCPSLLFCSRRHYQSLEGQLIWNFCCEVFLILRLEYFFLSLLIHLWNFQCIELFICLTFLIRFYGPHSQGSY